MSFRFDRNRYSGRVIVYIRDDIPSKQLKSTFIEVNLRKTKWLTFGTYCPPSQPLEYFFKHVGCTLDAYRQTYEKFFLAGDFNTIEIEPCLNFQLAKTITV